MEEGQVASLAATGYDAVPASGAACAVSYEMSPPIFQTHALSHHIKSQTTTVKQREKKISRNLLTAHTTS